MFRAIDHIKLYEEIRHIYEKQTVKKNSICLSILSTNRQTSNRNSWKSQFVPIVFLQEYKKNTLMQQIFFHYWKCDCSLSPVTLEVEVKYSERGNCITVSGYATDTPTEITHAWPCLILEKLFTNSQCSRPAMSINLIAITENVLKLMEDDCGDGRWRHYCCYEKINIGATSETLEIGKWRETVVPLLSSVLLKSILFVSIKPGVIH